VTHSGIDEGYWQESFWTSRRVLPESTRPVIANTALDLGPDDLEVRPYSEPESHPPRRDRIGW
jgi:hypothetical protein